MTFAIKFYLTILSCSQTIVFCGSFREVGSAKGLFRLTAKSIDVSAATAHIVLRLPEQPDKNGGASDSDNQPEHKTSKCQQRRDRMMGSVR